MTGQNQGMDDGRPLQRFIGGLMMAVGGLIAGLSGLCTLGVILIGASDGGLGQWLGMLPVVIIFGGAPILFGLAAFFGGRALYRAGKPKPDPQTFA